MSSADLCCSSLPFSSQLPSKSECPYLETGDPGHSVLLPTSQRSRKSLFLPSLSNSYYSIMRSTTENRNEGMEIQALAFSHHGFPSIKCCQRTEQNPNFNHQATLGSMCTCSAALPVLVVPELRQKHDRELRD